MFYCRGYLEEAEKQGVDGHFINGEKAGGHEVGSAGYEGGGQEGEV